MKGYFSILAIVISFSALASESGSSIVAVDSMSPAWSSVGDYTYWKEYDLSREEYCSESFIMNIVQNYGFEKLVFEDSNGNEWPLENYRHPNSDHPDHYYLDVEESNLLFSQPTFVCFHPSEMSVGLSFPETILSSYEYLLFEMQQDATYFVGDGGPQADVFANILIRAEAVIFELSYLSHNGWTVASRKAISSGSLPNDGVAGYITAKLPYPTQVRFRIYAKPTTINGSWSDILLENAKFLTQECVPDQANPGLCL
jgi:hypothetical protein